MTAARVLDALGNPVRRALVERLRSGALPVHELTVGFEVSRPAISRHLRVLREAGLVEFQRDGVKHRYALRPAGLEALRTYLDGFWDAAIPRFRLLAENLATDEGTGDDEATDDDEEPTR